jgi:hypothetical protein
MTSIFEIALRPIIVSIVFFSLCAYVFTYLLRHRLYFYATAGRRQLGSPDRTVRAPAEHVFVIQNLEDVDLGVAFKLSVSTTNNAGRITSVRLYAGKQGPVAGTDRFVPDGYNRFSLVVPSMPALDTWKVVCQSNDEAERMRLTLRGWDVRRNVRRSWFPVLSPRGMSITSRSAAVQRELTRPARRVAGMCLLITVLMYLWWVKVLAAGHGLKSGLAGLRAVAAYVYGLCVPLSLQVDGVVVTVLLIVGLFAVFMALQHEGLPIPLGYLGDESIEPVLRRYDSRREAAGPGSPPDPGGAPPPVAHEGPPRTAEPTPPPGSGKRNE